jgi:hypothetical protein
MSFDSSSIMVALGKNYHNNGKCFTCALCLGPFTTGSFGTADIDGAEVPVHSDCYKELFHPKCVHCKGPVPSSYARHPFFKDWSYCSPHENNVRRCGGCNRIESADGFADLNDSNRVLCGSCARTAILDTTELKPLWQDVLAFLDKELQLCVWPEMAGIPVLSVAYATLNEHRGPNSAHARGGSHTRGLCLTEVQRKGISVPSYAYDPRRGGYVTTHQHIDLGSSNAHVTGILCLSGLPKDLTASIVAHESIHAWLKLHPSYLSLRQPMDQQAEEGVCQLVAHLFLQDLEKRRQRRDSEEGAVGSGGMSDNLKDADLRKFFMYSVETDTSVVYGEGFRKAGALYAVLGLEPLLNSLVETGTLPE